MDALLTRAIADELRQPLPRGLSAAQARGWQDLEAVLGRVDTHAALFRARHAAVASSLTAAHGSTGGSRRSRPGVRPLEAPSEPSSRRRG